MKLLHFATLCAVAVATPAAAERPLEAFATLPKFTNPELSPNGQFIAAEMAFDGKQQLAVIPTDPSKGQSLLIDAGDMDLWDIRWVTDDWILVQTGFEGRITEKYADGIEAYLTRYVAFRADGKEQHVLEPRRNEFLWDGGSVIWTAQDGSPEILLAYRTSVYDFEPGFWDKVMRVNVATNKFELEVSPIEGVSQYFADGNGVVRVGIGTEKGGLRGRIVYRDRAGTALHEVASAEKDEELLTPYVFLADGKTALTLSSSDGFQALYKLDLDSMTLGDKVFGVPDYDIDGFTSNRTRDELAGVSWTDTTSRTQWFDPQMKDAQSLLDRTFAGSLVDIVSSSRDRTRHIVGVSTPATPVSYYLFDQPSKKVSLIARAHDLLIKGPNGPVTTIAYKARDGLEIPAVLTLPPGKEPKNLPLIVLPHGGPQARDSEGWDWWAQFLADRGYAVLQPNYRGSEGFGEKYLELGDGEWGLKMQDDIVDAKAWAVAQGIADPDRVCVVGASYGGYVAMRAAQRDHDSFRCAVSFAGVSDLPAMLQADRQGTFGRFLRDYWEDRTGDLSAVSPIKFPEQFGIPILLVHGKEDARVPVEQSRDLADRLRKAGKTVEYVEQPDGDHHFSRMEDRAQFLSVMETFLDKYNPVN